MLASCSLWTSSVYVPWKLLLAHEDAKTLLCMASRWTVPEVTSWVVSALLIIGAYASTNIWFFDAGGISMKTQATSAL
eukprot:4586094-Prymnesium_polylepis.1